MLPKDFLGGVVEGFYGPPWTQAQRLQCYEWMRAWGLNTYFYAPKDDLKHRALWREPYTPAELEGLGVLIGACRSRALRFIYGLAPGLTLTYSRATELSRVLDRFEQLLGIGCDHFALLFDDIPGNLNPEDRERFGSFAEAQAGVANAVWRWLRERRPESRFLFCPTPYCDRMVRWRLGGAGYLESVGARLDPGIDILWTGPEIVSTRIPLESIRAVSAVLRRPPVLWDNLHANDYDGRRVYCGPYAGRGRALRQEVRGILSNPNTEFPLNYVPIRSLAEYLRGEGEWDPRASYLAALRDWLREYDTVGTPLDFEDLRLLGDCYYLPGEDGPEAGRLLALLEHLVRCPPGDWNDAYLQFQELNRRIQSLFERLTELRHRELFYAWSRRVWDLKEELQLFELWLAQKRAQPDARPCFPSEGHLPKTFRGGIIARLQQILPMTADGHFAVGEAEPAGAGAGASVEPSAPESVDPS